MRIHHSGARAHTSQNQFNMCRRAVQSSPYAAVRVFDEPVWSLVSSSSLVLPYVAAPSLMLLVHVRCDDGRVNESLTASVQPY